MQMMPPCCERVALPQYDNGTAAQQGMNSEVRLVLQSAGTTEDTFDPNFFVFKIRGFLYLSAMCGPFKGRRGLLRLLEIIFSALSFIVVISGRVISGRVVSPWGVWCEFVWVFCTTVPLVLSVVEANMRPILRAVFLPNWADLTCGLTTLCAVMITSATVIFAAVFANILCFITSLVASVVFLIDGVTQQKTSPSGYLSGPRGRLRTTEAFTACIILTAAADHFVNGEWSFRPLGMICSITVFAVCLLVTVVIIVLHLLKLLQYLLSFRLSVMELVFNIAAVLLYLLAVVLWCVFGYKRYVYNPYICDKCSLVNMNTVTIGAVVNIVFYAVDLVSSLRSR